MAGSIGESIARGLESGFRLATDYNYQQEQQKRQSRYDELYEQDRQRTQQRQDYNDQIQALEAQSKQQEQEAKGYAGLTTPPPQAEQEAYKARVQATQQGLQSVLSKKAGVQDPAIALRNQGIADVAAIQAGTATPEQVMRGVTVATGLNPIVLKRGPNGEPAPVEVAVQQVSQGMEAGDMPTVAKGLNVLYHGKLQEGTGSDAIHDGKVVGKITGKEIMNVVPAPNSTQDDPKVVPVLRVYFNSGKPFRGPLPEGVPEGTTGHYDDAPMTEDRSADPNAKVKAISLKDGFANIEQLMKLTHLMNAPEGQQAFAQYKGPDPNEWVRTLAMRGAKPEGVKTEYHAFGAEGGILLKTDQKGVTTHERIEGPGRQETMLTMAQRLARENGTEVDEEYAKLAEAGQAGRRKSLFQEAQEYATNNNLSLTEVLKQMREGGIIRTPAGGLAGAPGRDEAERTKGQIQEVKASLADLKAKRDRASVDYGSELHAAAASVLPSEHKAAVAKAEANYAAKLKSIDEQEAALQKRHDQLNERLYAPKAEPPPPAPAPAKPSMAGGSKPAAAPGPPSPNRISAADQRERDNDAVLILEREVATIQEQLKTVKDTTEYPNAVFNKQQDLKKTQEELAKQRKLAGLPAQAPAPGLAASSAPKAAAAAPKPLPKAKGDLVVGDTYKTVKGTFRWNGSKLIEVAAQ